MGQHQCEVAITRFFHAKFNLGMCFTKLLCISTPSCVLPGARRKTRPSLCHVRKDMLRSIFSFCCSCFRSTASFTFLSYIGNK
jgi:hypothetical protein